MAKKQKSGLYRASVTINGRRIYVSGHTKRELEQQKERVRRQFETGEASDDLTFCDLVREWWERIELPKLSRAGTIAAYNSMITHHIIPGVDDRKLARAVRRADLQQVITNAAKTCNSRRLKNMKFLMSQICNYGMEIGLMAADYAHNLNTDKPDEPKPQRKEALTEDQIESLLTAVEGTDMQIPVALMYYLGLRWGEMMGITWSDVDLSAGYVYITKAYNLATKTIGPCKTKNAIRDIPIPEELDEILRPKRGLPNARLVVYENRQDFVVGWVEALLHAGAAHHRDDVKETHIYTNEQNYTTDYTPHQLRHTYATRLYDAGVDAVSASRILGHSSYAVTADIYTTISNQRKKRDAEKVKSAFRRCTEVARANKK